MYLLSIERLSASDAPWKTCFSLLACLGLLCGIAAGQSESEPPGWYRKKAGASETFVASYQEMQKLGPQWGDWHVHDPLPVGDDSWPDASDDGWDPLQAGLKVTRPGTVLPLKNLEWPTGRLPASAYLYRRVTAPVAQTAHVCVDGGWRFDGASLRLNGEEVSSESGVHRPRLREGANELVLRVSKVKPRVDLEGLRLQFKPPLTVLLDRLRQDFPEETLEVEAVAQFAELQRQMRWEKLMRDVLGDGNAWRRDRLRREAFSPQSLILETDRDPLEIVLRRTQALLDDLHAMPDLTGDLSGQASRLARIRRIAAQTPLESPRRQELYMETCRLRRRIAFSNPLLNFDDIVFLTHHRAKYPHMCDQYFGFHARPGGNVYILQDAFTDKPRALDILADSRVQNGRFQGRELENGSFISLELSCDARELAFAWTEAAPTRYEWSKQSTYHIFKARVDGSNLRQLTEGEWNDFDPCFLPDGRIVFISGRRGGYGRCHGRPVPTYTLHTMRPDGGDIIPISLHETNEWHPSVTHEGMIVYSRWDYVDRDSDIAHHPWTCYPDGRDPRSYHGNYPENRAMRPWMELAVRAVPGSHRFVAVAAPHHGQNYGSLILVDHRPPDDGATRQVTRITPDVEFAESEYLPGWPKGRGGFGDMYPGREIYGQPWPLSEEYHLCVYGRTGGDYGIYLVDGYGNREMLYRDPQVPCLDPIPLKPRPKPPAIPRQTLQAAEDRAGEPAPETGRIAVMNVYDADVEWPEGTEIKALRFVQVFPKTTPKGSYPMIGRYGQSLARGVIGTVPVEPDGSAYAELPANKPFYIQALDENGLAVQSMRSDAYVHPGEMLTCQGCHEPKRRTNDTARDEFPLALLREPSRPEPDVEGSYPVLYPKLVQPVLDKNCVACHAKHAEAPDLTGEPQEPGDHWLSDSGWSKSYFNLRGMMWGKSGGNGAIRGNGGCRSIPGKVGARAARLCNMLRDGHHEVQLTEEEMHRITLWLDCNSVFFGAYHETEKQLRGEVVMPRVQ